MSNAETDLRKAGDVKVAVVCPILIADPQEDIEAVRRVYLSLSKQIRKPDLIIFVDDGSPVPIGPNDLALVKDHKAAPTAIIRLKYNRGPAAARNAGINFAIISLGADPGRTIVFLLDIDCVAPADWIQRGCDAVLVHRPHISNQSMPSEPLIIAGISSGINPASIYTHYNDLFGILNPRIKHCDLDAKQSEKQPLYGPTCNLVVLPGSHNAWKALPRFHKGFREAAQEDLMFCLEAVYARGCEFIVETVGILDTQQG